MNHGKCLCGHTASNHYGMGRCRVLACGCTIYWEGERMDDKCACGHPRYSHLNTMYSCQICDCRAVTMMAEEKPVCNNTKSNVTAVPEVQPSTPEQTLLLDCDTVLQNLEKLVGRYSGLGFYIGTMQDLRNWARNHTTKEYWVVRNALNQTMPKNFETREQAQRWIGPNTSYWHIVHVKEEGV